MLAFWCKYGELRFSTAQWYDKKWEELISIARLGFKNKSAEKIFLERVEKQHLFNRKVMKYTNIMSCTSVATS